VTRRAKSVAGEGAEHFVLRAARVLEFIDQNVVGRRRDRRAASASVLDERARVGIEIMSLKSSRFRRRSSSSHAADSATTGVNPREDTAALVSCLATSAAMLGMDHVAAAFYGRSHELVEHPGSSVGIGGSPPKSGAMPSDAPRFEARAHPSHHALVLGGREHVDAGVHAKRGRVSP
jgi:hypothetical protein